MRNFPISGEPRALISDKRAQYRVVTGVALVTLLVEAAIMLFDSLFSPPWSPLTFSIVNALALAIVVGQAYAMLLALNRKPDRSQVVMAVILPALSLTSILATIEIVVHPALEWLIPAIGHVTAMVADMVVVTLIAMMLAIWFEHVHTHIALGQTTAGRRNREFHILVLTGIAAVMALAAFVNAVPAIGTGIYRASTSDHRVLQDLTVHQQLLAERIADLSTGLSAPDAIAQPDAPGLETTIATLRDEAQRLGGLFDDLAGRLPVALDASAFAEARKTADARLMALLAASDAHAAAGPSHNPDDAKARIREASDAFQAAERVVTTRLQEAIAAVEAEHDRVWISCFIISPFALFVIGVSTLGPIAAIIRAQDLRLKTRADTYEKLIAAVGKARSAIIVIDRQGLVAWVNSGVHTILGHEAVGVIGQHFSDLLLACKADQDLIAEVEAGLAAASPLKVQGEILSLDGKARHVEIEIQHAEAVSGPDDGFIAILSDMTEQANMRNFLNAIFQGVAEGIVIQRATGAIVSANPEACRLLGLSLDQLLGKTSFDPRWRAIDDKDDDLPGNRHPAMVALATGQDVRGAVMGVVDGEGARRWLSVNCKLAVDPVTSERIVIASFSDITREREREQELRLAHEATETSLAELRSYKTALDQHAIVSVADRAGRIIDVNSAFERISGYSRDEALGKTHRIINSGWHPKSFFTAMWQELAAGRSWSGEICNRAKDGTLYWVDTTIIPVRGNDSETTSFVSIRYDITDRVRAQSALMASTALAETKSRELELTLAHMNQGISAYDRDGRITIWNDKYAAMFGMRPDQVKAGMNLAELIAIQKANGDFPGDPAAFMAEIRANVERGAVFESITPQNNGRLIKTIHSPSSDGGHVSTHEDVTEREQASAAIHHAAQHDTLTGLPNRINITEHVAQALETGLARGERFSVLLIDLDRFKAVNDTFGHAMGDKLLKAAAGRMLDSVRSADVVARLGGDEFAIHVPASEDQDQVTRGIAKRLLAALSAPYEIDGRILHIGASIGAAIAPDHGRSVDELFRAADYALYHVKANGRQSWRIFDEDLAAKANDRRELEKDLRRAIDHDELSLHYQPYVSASDNRVMGVESLLRWHHPTRGMVPPDTFIPIAEDTGLIRSIGAWVVDRAARDAIHWPPHIKVAINASVAQFGHGDLVRSISSAMSAARLDPSRLEVEVTETVLLRDDPVMLAELESLKAMQVSIALDDFGTGYSSLKHLKMFPFDKIKIDRSFVSDMLDNPQSAAIVGALASLARSLDMAVTAEGVETPEQFGILKLAGCTFAQGYLLSRPLPFDEVTGFIREQEKMWNAGKIRAVR